LKHALLLTAWCAQARPTMDIDLAGRVILCDTFSIDEVWLSIQDESATSAAPAKMTRILQDQEKEIIESALAESRGKIAGKGGAAANSEFRRRRWIRRLSS
jgi:hypothetical protein